MTSALVAICSSCRGAKPQGHEFRGGEKQARRTELRDGVQEVEITVEGGYSPEAIELERGVAALMSNSRRLRRHRPTLARW